MPHVHVADLAAREPVDRLALILDPALVEQLALLVA